MTCPLSFYSKKIAKHLHNSEIYSKKSPISVNLNTVLLTLKTQNEYIDFLNLYLLTGCKGQKKKFYLSAAQKKYQTMFTKQTILNLQLNPLEFNKIMFYLFHYIFRDFVKQTQESVISRTKEACSVHIQDIPMMAYNKSLLFKSLFAHNINILNIKFDLHFTTRSFAKQMMYLKFFRYIVPVHLTWT